MIQHPRVVWGQFGSTGEAFLRRVVALQVEVDFAKLEVECVLVGSASTQVISWM